MEATITLHANKREVKGRKTEALRDEHIIPAVMYGFKTEPVSVQLSRGEFVRAYKDAGSSSIIDFDIDGTVHPVLVQDIQYDPLTDDVVHVDFRRINMEEKVETAIALLLKGVAPAVKDLGGTLIQNIEEVEVAALPNALVRELSVDVSHLATFNDVIRVADIVIPDGIEVLTDPERTVAIVQEPRVEEEPVVAEIEGDEVEGGEAGDQGDSGDEDAKDEGKKSSDESK